MTGLSALSICLAVAASLGTALIGGAFFAFSTFIMAALGRIPVAAGVAAMQSINTVVINPWFLGAFLGSALLGIAAATTAAVAVEPILPLSWLAAGATLYAIGTVGVTIAANVPRNNALARLDPAAPSTDPAWRRYLLEWTRRNHVRTFASLAAAACFVIALVAERPMTGPSAGVTRVSLEDAAFVPLDSARPELAQIAVLSGDPTIGPSAMLMRMAKSEGGLHLHSSDYHLVVVEGEMTHWTGEESAADARRLGRGSYWFQPGSGVHGNSCLTDSCLMFIKWEGKWDEALPEAPPS